MDEWYGMRQLRKNNEALYTESRENGLSITVTKYDTLIVVDFDFKLVFYGCKH